MFKKVVICLLTGMLICVVNSSPAQMDEAQRQKMKEEWDKRRAAEMAKTPEQRAAEQREREAAKQNRGPLPGSPGWVPPSRQGQAPPGMAAPPPGIAGGPPAGLTGAPPSFGPAPGGPASIPSVGTAPGALTTGAAPGSDSNFFSFSDPAAGVVDDIAALIPNQVVLLTGQRATDKITGRLLDDVYYDKVPEDIVDSLNPPANDDGEWPDLLANDGIWSNFTETNDYLSPESDKVKKQIIRMIEAAELMDPLEFFLIPVAASEPFSAMPHYIEKEQEHDQKIQEWNSKFLREYRRDPLSDRSEFWPMYVPRPPQLPNYPPPENFDALLLEPTPTPDLGPMPGPGQPGMPGGAPGAAPYYQNNVNRAVQANQQRVNTTNRF